ncbi:SGNH/GDSL hydrolase family protein [Ramlibacter humi]|uniref:Phospholipase n=1 Tax=Ramlibacter humi TaxID=2530451 RepID=A0A4Z0BFU3_9BURK|nr:SGNH/GDSL hydrolase family protein [Ramlibacter humi]TFY98182.1 phospholipase [Ramlibacter humi]
MSFPRSRRVFPAVLAALAAGVLVGCGGGGGSDSSSAPLPSAAAAPVSRVVVAGDSLADVGTAGFKATVQSAANPARGYPIYPEIVASSFGISSLCNYFSSPDMGQTFTTTSTNCTDFAVAGSLIVNPPTHDGDNSPFSLKHQLSTAVDANGGSWRGGDLIVVDAGGNDVAALADAYRNAQAGSASDQAIYLAFLAQQLSASQISSTTSQANGGSVAAGLYMTELAHTYWDTIRANTLDRGAPRVAILDVPDITLTPRLRTIIGNIATAQGSAAATQFQANVRSWIAGFNAELTTLAAEGGSRVVVAPYDEEFSAQIASPAAFGLTNVTEAACPPAAGFPACTDAALDAAPPPGLAPGWWKTWYFSDSFHPTPRGHELLAGTVNNAITRAGWR